MNTVAFSALSDRSRLRIVELLRERPRPVGEIAQRLRLRQPQVSKHLKVLSQAGLVRARPVAQKRIYHLEAQPFQELDGWLGSFRRLWEGRLEMLDEYLQEMKASQRRQP